MSSTVTEFRITGVNKGKTQVVHGHQFTDGVLQFEGSAEQAATLARIFEFYEVFPADTAELMELKAAMGEGSKLATPAAPTPEANAAAEAAAAQAALEQALGEDDAPSGRPTLAEAIGQLDPENDAHWTSNNLPSIDALAALTGKPATRAEVNELAEGYTRAKARSVRN
jgi:hypothetical protein